MIDTNSASTEAQLHPLLLHDLVFRLRMEIEVGTGLRIETGRDWHRFKHIRTQLRGAPPSPYFDPDLIGQEILKRDAFWMVVKRGGETVFLDAYRLDHVTGNFRAWLIGWLMSAHILLGEKSIIAEKPTLKPPATDALTGPLAYRGEVWMAPGLQQPLPDQMPTKLSLLSMALAWEQWKPNAIWGLTTQDNLRNGRMARVGHSSSERDFIVWKKKPACVESHSETLVYSTCAQIVSQLATACSRL